MNGPRVIVVGGKLPSVRKAAEAGLDVVHIQKPAQFDPAALAYCGQVHLVDYQNIPLVTAVASAVHAVTPVARVLSQAEAALVVAGHLTTHLGLPGTSATTAWTLHDKAATRALLNSTGIGPVAAEVGSTRAALEHFVRRHGPAVVKPRMASGSLGVRKVAGPGGIDAAWRWLDSFGLTDFLVEELLTGVEVSVETFSRAGQHVVVAVTGKDTGGGTVELGHLVPANLPPADVALVSDFTCRVLDAVGLVDGLAHTEVMLTAQGPRLVESHNRRGGGRINDLVRLVSGVDMERLVYESVREDAPPPPTGALDGAAAVRFLLAEPGRVVSVTGTEEAAALDGVVEVEVTVQPGDMVRPVQWSEDRCGHVLVRAADPASAQRLARRAAARIHIRTAPAGDAKPVSLHSILAEVGEVLYPSSSVRGSVGSCRVG